MRNPARRCCLDCGIPTTGVRCRPCAATLKADLDDRWTEAELDALIAEQRATMPDANEEREAYTLPSRRFVRLSKRWRRRVMV